MSRWVAAVVLLLVSASLVPLGCGDDDDDPAASEHCKAIRLQWLEAKYNRDRAVQHAIESGFTPPYWMDAQLDKLWSDNIECFPQ